MEPKKTYTIEKEGLILPIEWFEKYGLKQGDEVSVMEMAEGLMVLPHAEAEWEDAILTEVLSDSLRMDGSIDFDALRKKTLPITLEELYPEGDELDES